MMKWLTCRLVGCLAVIAVVLAAGALLGGRPAAMAQERGSASAESESMDELWGDQGVELTEDNRSEWFRANKYGLFLHWGLFSQAAGKWEDTTYYGITEWLMWRGRIPVADYETLAGQFNPEAFDARAWARFAKQAGFRYIVITAKHHDGFAMFDSVHPFNVVDATPFGRDPMRELADACRDEGLGFGFYYSQYQDWHEINDWDGDLPRRDFAAVFEEKIVPQVEELCTGYGPLSFVWFDTPGAMTREQSMRLVDLVREHQPQALINSRVGNGVGDYSTYGDHEIPPRNVEGVWEAIDTSNNSWGFAWYDDIWKDSETIAHNLISVVARGGNYMLNIGPKPDGTLPADNVAFLEQVGQWLALHGETIYGAGPSPWGQRLPFGEVTTRGQTLYLHVFDWTPGGKLRLYGLDTEVRQAVLRDETQTALAFEQDDAGWLTVTLPMAAQPGLVPVVELTLAGEPEVDSRVVGLDHEHPTTLLSHHAEVAGCRHGKASWMETFGEWKHVITLDGWQDGGTARWPVIPHAAGRWAVEIEYNAFDEADASDFALTVEQHGQTTDTANIHLLATTGPRGHMAPSTHFNTPRYRFMNRRVAVIHLETPGPYTLTLQPRNGVKASGPEIHAIRLVPLD